MSSTNSASASKRGRKRDDNLPPNRARDVQRAFRARRASHLEALEQRVIILEDENAKLRAAMDLPPSDRPPLGTGPTGRGKLTCYMSPPPGSTIQLPMSPHSPASSNSTTTASNPLGGTAQSALQTPFNAFRPSSHHESSESTDRYQQSATSTPSPASSSGALSKPTSWPSGEHHHTSWDSRSGDANATHNNPYSDHTMSDAQAPHAYHTGSNASLPSSSPIPHNSSHSFGNNGQNQSYHSQPFSSRSDSSAPPLHQRNFSHDNASGPFSIQQHPSSSQSQHGLFGSSHSGDISNSGSGGTSSYDPSPFSQPHLMNEQDQKPILSNRSSQSMNSSIGLSLSGSGGPNSGQYRHPPLGGANSMYPSSQSSFTMNRGNSSFPLGGFGGQSASQGHFGDSNSSANGLGFTTNSSSGQGRNDSNSSSSNTPLSSTSSPSVPISLPPLYGTPNPLSSSRIPGRLSPNSSATTATGSNSNHSPPNDIRSLRLRELGFNSPFLPPNHHAQGSHYPNMEGGLPSLQFPAHSSSRGGEQHQHQTHLGQGLGNGQIGPHGGAASQSSGGPQGSVTLPSLTFGVGVGDVGA